MQMREPEPDDARPCQRCGRPRREYGYLLGWQPVCRPCWLDAKEYDNPELDLDD
jgi:hypothetical protein